MGTDLAKFRAKDRAFPREPLFGGIVNGVFDSLSVPTNYPARFVDWLWSEAHPE